VVGYLVYCVGAITAFIAVRLALSDAEAGLHSSALAIGVIVAGVTAHRLDGLWSMRMTHFVALGSLGLGAVLLAWAPAIAATLLGAAGVGFGAGLLLSHVNQIMAAGGGAIARVRLARGTLIAMLASVTVPLFIGLGEASGMGWQLALVPGLALVLAAVAATRHFEERPMDVAVDRARLPASFWTAWILVILVIAAEFAVIFWSSTLVERRSGVSLAEATLGISAFVGGIIAGRIALSSHAVSARDPVLMLRVAVVLAIVGLLLPWASTSYEVAMLGMFVSGIGVGALYPVAASITLATAPDQARVISGRLVLGSGLAILVAPFVLGVAADLVGVVAAWLLVPGICLLVLLLTIPVGRDRARRLAAGHSS
jgi:fucose permease